MILLLIIIFLGLWLGTYCSSSITGIKNQTGGSSEFIQNSNSLETNSNSSDCKSDYCTKPVTECSALNPVKYVDNCHHDGFTDGFACRRINRSAVTPKVIPDPWGYTTCGPKLPESVIMGNNLENGKTNEQIIKEQKQLIKKYHKMVTEFETEYEAAGKAGQTIFRNPLQEYKQPLADPTRPPEEQVVQLGILPEQLEFVGGCTLDATGNVVCNPTLWERKDNKLVGTDFLKLQDKSLEFFLFRNIIRPGSIRNI